MTNALHPNIFHPTVYQILGFISITMWKHERELQLAKLFVAGNCYEYENFWFIFLEKINAVYGQRTWNRANIDVREGTVCVNVRIILVV